MTAAPSAAVLAAAGLGRALARHGEAPMHAPPPREGRS